MSASPVSIGAWPAWLAEWVGGAQDAGSPARRPLQIRGRINPRDAEFAIGESRDAVGTLVRIAPAFPPVLEKQGEGGKAPGLAEREKTDQKWRQLWAKVAVRAGYLHPGIDPEAYRVLCELRDQGKRVELIFDTSELVSGSGHWLVRFFGKHVDVVTTVISQREVHGWWDSWAGKRVNSFDKAEHRANYLAAARFIERLPHGHPIWRTLDVNDEGALLLADGSRNGTKSQNADTLLFRAAKRYILDQVPSLRRFFVTGDVGVARAAAHVLPAGSTITTWISAIPREGLVLGPVHWWNTRGDYGSAIVSDLATFVVEALAVCAEVTLERADGATLVARLFTEGSNQYPSTWRAPVIWVDVSAAAAGAVPVQSVDEPPPAGVREALPDPAELPTTDLPATPGRKRWPLHFTAVRPKRRRPTGARLTPRVVLDGIESVMLAARDGALLDLDALEQTMPQGRDLRRLLVDGLEFVTATGAPTSVGEKLPDIFARGDLDELSSLVSVLDPFARALEAAAAEQARTHRRGEELPRDRKLETFLALARALGLVVCDQQGAMHFGAANHSREALVKWLRRTLEELSVSEPLGEVPVLVVAQRALDELSLSPARLELALEELLVEEPRLVGKEGASESKVLVENVAHLSKDGVLLRDVSADGLCGQRALAWRNA